MSTRSPSSPPAPQKLPRTFAYAVSFSVKELFCGGSTVCHKTFLRNSGVTRRYYHMSVMSHLRVFLWMHTTVCVVPGTLTVPEYSSSD